MGDQLIYAVLTLVSNFLQYISTVYSAQNATECAKKKHRRVTSTYSTQHTVCTVQLVSRNHLEDT